ncbi:hypothetical protein ASE39_08945 [Acidovorax sp. Root267]|nr:hypothetical protein ASE39_08945 [Acidovorax sp. Root267]
MHARRRGIQFKQAAPQSFGSTGCPDVTQPSRPACGKLEPWCLLRAGAELVTTEMVAFEWLGSSEHAAFKDVLGLIK